MEYANFITGKLDCNDGHDALVECFVHGASILEGFLAEDFRLALLEELKGHVYTSAREKLKDVRQKFDRFAFKYGVPEGMPFLEVLKRGTERMVQASGPRIWTGFKSWTAMDIVVQKYGPDGFLTAHKDLDRHPLAIVIYTVTGSCKFDLLDDRDGNVTASFTPRAGDVMLLRANNPTIKGIDVRPFHRVGGSLAHEPRISVTFRDNLKPELEIPGFAYEKIR
jgi:hypothetical protein